MLEGAEEGVVECKNPKTWFSDLTRALRKLPALEMWSTTFTITKGTDVNEGKLTSDQVANELRLYNATATAAGPRRWKASFGAQEGEFTAHFGEKRPAPTSAHRAKRARTESADEQESPGQERTPRRNYNKKSSRGYRGGKGSKGKGEPSGEGRKRTKHVRFEGCLACNKNHPLSNCWLAFSDQAPDHYRDNEPPTDCCGLDELKILFLITP